MKTQAIHDNEKWHISEDEESIASFNGSYRTIINDAASGVKIRTRTGKPVPQKMLASTDMEGFNSDWSMPIVPRREVERMTASVRDYALRSKRDTIGTAASINQQRSLLPANKLPNASTNFYQRASLGNFSRNSSLYNSDLSRSSFVKRPLYRDSVLERISEDVKPTGDSPSYKNIYGDGVRRINKNRTSTANGYASNAVSKDQIADFVKTRLLKADAGNAYNSRSVDCSERNDVASNDNAVEERDFGHALRNRSGISHASQDKIADLSKTRLQQADVSNKYNLRSSGGMNNDNAVDKSDFGVKRISKNKTSMANVSQDRIADLVEARLLREESSNTLRLADDSERLKNDDLAEESFFDVRRMHKDRSSKSNVSQDKIADNANTRLLKGNPSNVYSSRSELCSERMINDNAVFKTPLLPKRLLQASNSKRVDPKMHFKYDRRSIVSNNYISDNNTNKSFVDFSDSPDEVLQQRRSYFRDKIYEKSNKETLLMSQRKIKKKRRLDDSLRSNELERRLQEEYREKLLKQNKVIRKLLEDKMARNRHRKIGKEKYKKNLDVLQASLDIANALKRIKKQTCEDRVSRRSDRIRRRNEYLYLINELDKDSSGSDSLESSTSFEDIDYIKDILKTKRSSRKRYDRSVVRSRRRKKTTKLPFRSLDNIDSEMTDTSDDGRCNREPLRPGKNKDNLYVTESECNDVRNDVLTDREDIDSLRSEAIQKIGYSLPNDVLTNRKSIFDDSSDDEPRAESAMDSVKVPMVRLQRLDINAISQTRVTPISAKVMNSNNRVRHNEADLEITRPTAKYDTRRNSKVINNNNEVILNDGDLEISRSSARETRRTSKSSKVININNEVKFDEVDLEFSRSSAKKNRSTPKSSKVINNNNTVILNEFDLEFTRPTTKYVKKSVFVDSSDEGEVKAVKEPEILSIRSSSRHTKENKAAAPSKRANNLDVSGSVISYRSNMRSCYGARSDRTLIEGGNGNYTLLSETSSVRSKRRAFHFF